MMYLCPFGHPAAQPQPLLTPPSQLLPLLTPPFPPKNAAQNDSCSTVTIAFINNVYMFESQLFFFLENDRATARGDNSTLCVCV